MNAPTSKSTQQPNENNAAVTTPDSTADLRTKVVEILSATANGCLSELGYFPGMSQRLQNAEQLNQSWKTENTKLFQDNSALSRLVAKQRDQLRFIAASDNQKVEEFLKMREQMKALLQERGELIRTNQALVSGADPTKSAYIQLMADYNQLMNTHRAAMNELVFLRAEFGRMKKAASVPAASPTVSQPVVPNPNRHPQRRASDNTVQHIQASNPTQQKQRFKQTMSIVTDWSRESIPGRIASFAESHNSMVTNGPLPVSGSAIHPKSRTPSISRPPSSLGRPPSSAGHRHSLSSPGHPAGSSSLNGQIHLPEATVKIPLQSIPAIPPAGLQSSRHPFASPSDASAVNQLPGLLTPLQTQSEPIWIDSDSPPPSIPAPMHPEPEPHQPQQPLALETAPAPPLSETLRLRSQLQSQSSTPLEDNLTGADHAASIEEVPVSTSISSLKVEEDSQMTSKRTLDGDVPGNDDEPALKKARLDDTPTVPVVKTPEIEAVTESSEMDPSFNEPGGCEIKGDEQEDDDDEEDEEDEIGPDGLRLPEFCVAAIMEDDEDDENKKTCRLCIKRHQLGYTKEAPAAFIQATLEQLMQHCTKDHPAAWEKLRHVEATA